MYSIFDGVIIIYVVERDLGGHSKLLTITMIASVPIHTLCLITRDAFAILLVYFT